MIPYISLPSVSVGPLTLSTFKLSVLIAVVVGVAVVIGRASSAGLDRRTVAGLLTWTIITAFFGSRAFDLAFYQPEVLYRDPLELLRFWRSLSSFGAILGMLLGAWLGAVHLRLSRCQLAAFIETVGFALPFAWIPARLGCALVHDHPGIYSDHWLAVDFPQGPRFDLGLLELLYVIPIAVAFAFLGRRPRPVGFYLPLFLVLYGPGRLAMDTLRVWDARYLGWTAAQYAAIAGILIGAVLLGRAYRAGGVPIVR